jgi:hypothetical protein
MNHHSDQEYDVHAPASTYYTTGSNSATSGVGRNRSVTTFSVSFSAFAEILCIMTATYLTYYSEKLQMRPVDPKTELLDVEEHRTVSNYKDHIFSKVLESICMLYGIIHDSIRCS